MEGTLIEGVVEHGRRLGREIGFPTVNITVPEHVTVSDGVYQSRVEVDGEVYDAMSNVGCNPSVGGKARRLESHLFGFSGELYGSHIKVCLLRKIRDERKFGSLEELQAQIARDKARILELNDKSNK